MMKCTYYIILFLLFFTFIARAQDLTVKSFTSSTDVDASVHRVNDLNGQACALVKVMVTDEVINAKGASVVTLTNGKAFQKKDANEYWVYLAKGARHLTVATRNHLPLKVVFQDYGITTLEGLTTYVLRLNANKQARQQKLIINYSPANALVLVDSKPYQGNGHIEIPLSVGSHEYQIAAIGHVTAEGTVKLSEEAPRIINETLQRSSSAQNNATETPLQGNTASTIAPSNINTTFSPTTTVQTTDHSGTIQAPNTPSSDGIETFTVNGVTFNMVRVDGGTFQMGSNDSEAKSDERPVHQVTLSSYYIGETEVTQALWQAVMGSNPSNWKGSNLPVENVSWDNCQQFIEKLNNLTDRRFRLPTEAEWEYAARGGNKSQAYKYSGSNLLDDVGWYWKNSGDYYLPGADSDRNSDKIKNNNDRTHPVKTKKPNELGIYDMSGNVWEWCQNQYGSYSSSFPTTPTGSSIRASHVHRGGYWGSNARDCRSSSRSFTTPFVKTSSLGLRLVLSKTSTQINTSKPTYSDYIKVHGHVYDAKDKDGLIGASVFLLKDGKKTSTVTVSDFDGNFTIAVPTIGKHSLKISYVGYKDSKVDIDKNNNQKLEIPMR